MPDDRYLIIGGAAYVDGTEDRWHAQNNQASGDGGLFTEATDAARLSGFVTGSFGITGDMVCQGFYASGYERVISTGSGAGLDVNAGSLILGAGQLGPTISGSADISAVGDISIGLNTNFSSFTGTLIQDGTSGDPTITTNGCVLPDMQINNNGVTTCKLVGSLACGVLTLTAGKLDDDAAGTGGPVTCDEFDLAGAIWAGSGDLTVNGDFTTSSGTWSHTGKVVMAATADLDHAVNTPLVELEVPAGVTVTCLDPTTYLRKFSGAGTVEDNGGGETFYFQPNANGFWNFTGTANVGLLIYIGAGTTRTTGRGITLGDKGIRVISGGITASGPISIGTGTLDLDADGHIVLNMVTFSLTAGDWIMGKNAGAGNVTVNLGTGLHNISGDIAKDTDCTGTLTMALDTSTLNLVVEKSLDGTDFTFSNTSAAVIGGTVDNCDLTGETELLHLWPATAGTGNTNVLEVAPFNRDLSLSPGLGLVA